MSNKIILNFVQNFTAAIRVRKLNYSNSAQENKSNKRRPKLLYTNIKRSILILKPRRLLFIYPVKLVITQIYFYIFY